MRGHGTSGTTGASPWTSSGPRRRKGYPRDPVDSGSLTRRSDRGRRDIFLLHRTLSAPRANDPLSARGVHGSLSTSRNLSAVADGRRGTDSLPRLRARDPYCLKGKMTGDAHRPCLSSRIGRVTFGQSTYSSRFLVCDPRFRHWSQVSSIKNSAVPFIFTYQRCDLDRVHRRSESGQSRFPTRLARRRRRALLRPFF